MIKAGQKLPEGDLRVEFAYTHESKEYGGGGIGRLLIDGKQVAEAKFMHVVPARYSATETMDIGCDLGAAVSKQ